MAMLRVGRNSSTKFLPWLRRFASNQGRAAGAEPPSISEWDDLIGELATEEEKREVSALKNHVLDLRHQLAPKSLGPERVPFEHYKKQLGEDGEIVDKLKESYEKIQVPKLSGLADHAAEELKHLEAEADKEVEEANERAKKIQEELERVRKQKEMLQTATVDEMLDSDPKLREEIDAEIERGEWY